jgi:predicted transcriptional regulator
MLRSTSIVEAAEEAGLGRRTIYRYLREETFRLELRKAQDEVLAGTTAALVGLSEVAVETLHGVMTDDFASDSVRVRAALGWLSHQREMLELMSLSERVRRLEEVTRER